ncbi:cellulose binding domain-containing protein [Microtetraspora malaysiensis]|uniref:Cellulose binding domain-containing protein n=1 Tax=Microtetraspora malaysiensis TaxID=161358 RepID=A0ABW6SRM6_9ACTN
MAAGPETASPSVTPSASPSAPPSGGKTCTATYTVTNSWSDGFQGEVAVKNTGTAAMSGWTVKWTFPNGQTISQLWNGTLAANGSSVTVTNLSWNGALAVNASTTFGFSASLSGANDSPASVTCTAS